MLTVAGSVQESVIADEDNDRQRGLNMTILAVHGKQGQFGFEVDSDASIHRWEARERIRYSIEHSKAHTSSRSRFNSWLNGRARGAGRLETLNPWDVEVETYV
jgi:sRNA-binding carbon storage regulator CsrA